MEITLSEIAALLGGSILSGSGELRLTGVASLTEAGPEDLSFFGNEKYINALKSTRAGAVLVPTGFAEVVPGVAFVVVDNPSLAFGRFMERLAPPPAPFVPGVHPTAVVHPEAKFDAARVAIGPHVTVEAGVEIGPGSRIGAGCFLGEGARLGADCHLHPRVSVLHRCVLGDRVILHSGVVIGADGFGFELVGQKREKVQQVGIVIVEEDVEIGANSCVDRARFGKTIVGAGTKIDNLVQIAHNVVIGKNVVIAAQTGVAGSVRIHDGAIIAAQVGIAGHLEIGSGVTLTAQTGVTKSLLKPGSYMGHRAEPMNRMLRIWAALNTLPDVINRLRKLEERAGRDEGGR